MRYDWKYLGMAAAAAGLVLGACAKKEAAPAAAPQTGAIEAEVKPKEIEIPDADALKALALEVLQAYRNKNVEVLARLGPKGASEQVIFIEPRNPNYERLLGDSSWRMQALKAWDGELETLSVGLDKMIVAWFHEDDSARYGVELHETDGRWHFFDLRRQEK